MLEHKRLHSGSAFATAHCPFRGQVVPSSAPSTPGAGPTPSLSHQADPQAHPHAQLPAELRGQERSLAPGFLSRVRGKARPAQRLRREDGASSQGYTSQSLCLPLACSDFSNQCLPCSLQELKEVGKEQPRSEAEHPANITKNRYPHVLPCEHWGRDRTWAEGQTSV